MRGSCVFMSYEYYAESCLKCASVRRARRPQSGHRQLSGLQKGKLYNHGTLIGCRVSDFHGGGVLGEKSEKAEGPLVDFLVR